MGRSRYKFYEEHYPYFITSTILEELPLLSNPQIAQIVLDQFVFMQQEKMLFYTLMSYAQSFSCSCSGKGACQKTETDEILYST